ncbi:centromere protein S-like isoform X1 [Schistocerca gregaria]|uniref:centromere protein S-like isoform X1 n=1 Tax=Schistocerca gregaria TaxID=7010 RepID=UPI00211EC414|nr:centromere protein S-like isoform X1 [Schistocerca gregaria]
MSSGMSALKKEEILKIILFQEVDRVVTETSKEIGVTCSSEVVNVFAEMAWKKARSIAEDLELFAKHAKRSMVSSDDVKLVVRRNPSLSQQEPPSRDIRRLFIYLQQYERKTYSTASNIIDVQSNTSD